ncbi:MAG: hypothetical protein E3J37_08345 [Anaerolineales bacterium]|nr:MAG: hypothetical protein E3J37_08345 [Anaerolineales bacterium]
MVIIILKIGICGGWASPAPHIYRSLSRAWAFFSAVIFGIKKKNSPAWFDEIDSDWSGDYWVHYWDPEWQAIIYGSPESYLDWIMNLGFDRVYLDRVDAYWH